MKFETSGESGQGKFREINQDYFYIDNQKGVFIVCDGVGGAAAGEVASHRAIEFTIEYLDSRWSEVEDANQSPTGLFRLTQLVEKTIHSTCKRLHALGSYEPALRGMATTLTMMLMVDGKAVVGHVGDSRLYICRDEKVFLLTTDHTLAAEMFTLNERIDLNDIKKFRHCLTRSVGSDESVAVETLIFDAYPSDVLLLCTDGLSNFFTDSKQVAAMLSGSHVSKIAHSLVRFANHQGGEDDITALVVRILDVDDFAVNARRVRVAGDATGNEEPDG